MLTNLNFTMAETFSTSPSWCIVNAAVCVDQKLASFKTMAERMEMNSQVLPWESS